jgi:hypothetical protein
MIGIGLTVYGFSLLCHGGRKRLFFGKITTLIVIIIKIRPTIPNESLVFSSIFIFVNFGYFGYNTHITKKT